MFIETDECDRTSRSRSDLYMFLFHDNMSKKQSILRQFRYSDEYIYVNVIIIMSERLSLRPSIRRTACLSPISTSPF